MTTENFPDWSDRQTDKPVIEHNIYQEGVPVKTYAQLRQNQSVPHTFAILGYGHVLRWKEKTVII